MKRPVLLSVCSIAVFIFGCPKRQTTPLLVYVPAPAPAAASPSEPAGGVLVIPTPPPPPETPAAETITPEPPEPKPAPRRRHHAPAEAQASDSGSETSEPEVTVPALETRETPEQRGAVRRRIIQLHADIEGRMAQLHAGSLTAQQKKTLDDAQQFLSQSQHALVNGDLTRALNLARKASLLVGSL